LYEIIEMRLFILHKRTPDSTLSGGKQT